ncbi:hypothetical protein CIB95_08920 [Lottiidibacillus patelloidae]|uniref:Uncharacterized protein n=1 Tax=Lottiidibacillus patelloidae TaxID=2670334 RepID=A0A263BTJ2_9BACI|nr:hypothetical protein [Lottiidibacillus patelloidae]OZM56882.1 hypothetical protein CIB95_08920 [Lottiidibacillus patelloidae]
MLTMQHIKDAINSIPTYSLPNELAQLSFQSKSEYLFRDKLSLYFSDQFSQGNTRVFPIREWQISEPWGIPRIHFEVFCKKLNIDLKILNSKKRELKELRAQEKEKLKNLPPELRNLCFIHELSSTQAIDLALFEYPEKRPKNNPIFPLTTLIEFKCEVIYQLTNTTLKSNNYIFADIERMDKFTLIDDRISYFEILVLIDFPLGFDPKWYSLKNHYKQITEFNKNNPNALNTIDAFIKETFGSSLHIENTTLDVGTYLQTPVKLHFWIFTKK